MAVLPDISTNAGVMSRLIIAECKNPGYDDYTEDDGKLSFRLMQAVISNRLKNNPSQFGAAGATTYADIISAPNQFAGFSSNGGTIVLSQSVSDRIDAVLKKANAGSPGPYLAFVQDILNQVGATINDPLSGVTTINGTAVQGGVYGWRTLGTGDPGGLFFPIPPAFGGVVLGNQFYTLLAPTVSDMELEESAMA
jgi:hypothetical protein